MRMNEPLRMGCEVCNKRNEMQFQRAVMPFPDDWAIAMAYVPMQTDTTSYEPLQALCEGTLFVALNKPFKRGCAK